jgi:CRISPR-associated protein Csb2
MIVIKLEFLAGRFHATPFGRNVNEAVTEWPPSSYRFLRAIIDVWKRKKSDISQDNIERLFELLASSTPVYSLPDARESKIAVYMNINDKNSNTKKRLIYDAFVAINPEDPVFLGWMNISLDDTQKLLLTDLLKKLNYFGRSESWIKATMVSDQKNIEWNCYPFEQQQNYNLRFEMEKVQVAIPVPKIDYAKNQISIKEKNKKKVERKIEWLEAFMLNTQDVIDARLSKPPALKYETYLRKRDCFNKSYVNKSLKAKEKINTVLYALDSKILPLVTETIKVSENVRTKLMGIYKIVADTSYISPKFSGKNQDGSFLTGHQHIYILPLDSDEDGRIDHILITCKEPFDGFELSALDKLTSLWQSDGKPDIRCVLIQLGSVEDINICKVGTTFKSVTPFVPTRHYRKGRGNYDQWLENEVKHEAKNHGLPEPVAVRKLEKLDLKGHSYYWLEFIRNRKEDSIRSGYGFEIEFSDPIPGPFSIGYGAHYGLGTFKPIKKE